MRNIAAYTFVCSGFLAMLVGGAWGLILTLRALIELGGFWFVVIGALLAPLTVAFLPFYMGLVQHDWTILRVDAITLGVSGVLIGAGMWIGKFISRS